MTMPAGGAGPAPRAYFDGRAPRYWTDLYGGPATNHYQLLLRKRRAIVQELMQGLDGPVLDLGSGPGLLSERRADRRLFAVGDISLEMVRQARNRAGADAVYAQLSASALPFAPRTFGLITAIGVLEYVDDEAASLREIHAALREDGVAILTFPAHKPFEELLRRAARLVSRRQPALSKRLDRERGFGAVCRILDGAGFRIEEVRPFHYFYFPWCRLFFGASRRVDAAFEWTAGRVPPAGRLAQSWVFKVVRKP